MSLFQLFKASFATPKKLAAFRLLPIGKVMQYVFIFVAVLSILSFIDFARGFEQETTGISGLLEYVNDMQWILYPFALAIQFIMSTLLVFVRISIMAFVGLFLLKLLKRRGEYRHVWRTTAVSYTVPTLLSIILLLLNVKDSHITLATTAICLIYLLAALKYYPKK